jgi:hypothetical protein
MARRRRGMEERGGGYWRRQADGRAGTAVITASSAACGRLALESTPVRARLGGHAAASYRNAAVAQWR